MQREHDVTGYRWPEVMRVADSGRQLHLIEDVLADRLTKGDPIFGWEGDPRLALYIDYAMRTWELWRLESDGVMRPTVRLSADTWKGPDAVGEMIARLIATDQRRGVNVLKVVESAAATADAAKEAKRTAHVEDFADRFAYALGKDGVG